MNETTTLETGCYIDGLHGIYVFGMLCELAQSLGWEEENIPSMDDFDELVEASDEALAFLNGIVSGSGRHFEWHEGGIFLWEDEDWEEVY